MFCKQCGKVTSENKNICVTCEGVLSVRRLNNVSSERAANFKTFENSGSNDDIAVQEPSTILQAKVDNFRRTGEHNLRFRSFEDKRNNPEPHSNSKINSPEKESGNSNSESEKQITGIPSLKKIELKRSKSYYKRRRTIKTVTWIAATPLIICSAFYILWIVSDQRNIFKSAFSTWMQENANAEVNTFAFETLALNNFYKAPVPVDFSGTYKSAINEGDELNLFSKGYELSGTYIFNGKKTQVKGLSDKNGNYLLKEIYDGQPTGFLQGRIFSATGFINGNRYSVDGNSSLVLSFEKSKSDVNSKASSVIPR